MASSLSDTLESEYRHLIARRLDVLMQAGISFPRAFALASEQAAINLAPEEIERENNAIHDARYGFGDRALAGRPAPGGRDV